MLPSADQLFKNADLILHQDLAPAHTAKSTKINILSGGQQITKNVYIYIFFFGLLKYSNLLRE